MTRRVSDETFNAICDYAQREYVKGDATTMQMIALDARDLRAKLAAAEQRLGVAERDRTYWMGEHDRELQERQDAEQRIAGAKREGMEVAHALAYDFVGRLGNPQCHGAAKAAKAIAIAIAALPPAPPTTASPAPVTRDGTGTENAAEAGVEVRS